MFKKLIAVLNRNNEIKKASTTLRKASIKASMYGDNSLINVPSVVVLKSWINSAVHKHNTCTMSINGVLIKAVKCKGGWSCHCCNGVIDEQGYTKALYILLNSESV